MKKTGYIVSGIILSVLIILITIYEYKGNYYQVSSKDVHEASLKTELLVSKANLSKTQESILLVILSEEQGEEINLVEKNNSIQGAPSEILKNNFRKQLKKHEGIIILHANKIEIAINAWVILSRMGYENCRILSDTNSEILKYTFQPDQMPD